VYNQVLGSIHSISVYIYRETRLIIVSLLFSLNLIRDVLYVLYGIFLL
jgi:hypothetical protein